jgi:integrase/recombinase XerD
MNNWSYYIKTYQQYLKLERGLSSNSIANYTFDIERLSRFLQENAIEVSPIKIQEGTIQQFIYSISKEINPRSQARIISGLKSYLAIFTALVSLNYGNFYLSRIGHFCLNFLRNFKR